MLDQKTIEKWKKFMKNSGGVEFSGYSDQKIRKEAEKWFNKLNNPKVYQRKKKTKLFHKTIAIIRQKPSVVILPSTLKKMFKSGYARAANLFIELVDSGIITDFGTDKDRSPKIIWKNVKKSSVPKAINDQIKQDLKSGRQKYFEM